MTHALVDRDELETLLMYTYEIVSGSYTPDICTELKPDDVIVTLAVQAGVVIPGPLAPGTVPPPPPHNRFRGGAPVAGCFRAEGDLRLRCIEDAKVVYSTKETAQAAANHISAREPMKAYMGRCGHWHVARKK